METRLGLVLGYGNPFGVESVQWGGGRAVPPPPLQAIPWPAGPGQMALSWSAEGPPGGGAGGGGGVLGLADPGLTHLLNI